MGFTARSTARAGAVADQAEDLAVVDGEGDVVHRLDVPDGALEEAPLDREVLLEPLHAQQWRAVRVVGGRGGARGVSHGRPPRGRGAGSRRPATRPKNA